jgi:hypothetical protein
MLPVNVKVTFDWDVAGVTEGFVTAGLKDELIGVDPPPQANTPRLRMSTKYTERNCLTDDLRLPAQGEGGPV